MLEWGLVPSWADDPKQLSRPINARAETVAASPMFRGAFANKRCLIPVSGFYEWKKRDDGKQPYWIGRQDREPFAFAGLWEGWKTPEGETVETCTIITVEPNELISTIHHRMAAILKPDDEATWIDPKSGVDDLLQLLRPYESDELEAVPVSRAVNSPTRDDPALIVPVEGA